MRLRFIDGDLASKNKELKPKVGDTILYEGQKYIAKEVGLRYLRGVKVGGSNAVYVMKIADVSKWFPEAESGVSPNLNFTP